MLILLCSAVLAVVLCRKLGLPAMLGYLGLGIATGPHALGLVAQIEDMRHLAEFGVVFLMFTIGLEFSLARLLSMRRIVFGLGAAQVAATLVAMGSATLLLGGTWISGLVVGFVLVTSSTAILGKLLEERMELNSKHGQQIIGVALFQDLAVVPMLILIPTFGAVGGDLVSSLLSAGLKAVAAFVLILVLGQRLIRPWFHVIARQRSSELFMLNVLFITLGLAYATDQAGLSLALGAFLGGMLISETEYRYQVEDDIKSFRDVLLGLFFVSIGMLLDMRALWDNLPLVLVVWVGFYSVKATVVIGLAKAFRLDSATALRTGLALGVAGEFGFVLLALAMQHGLLTAYLAQIVLAAMVLSMLAEPFIMGQSERLVDRFCKSDWMLRAMQITSLAARTMATESHIIICGYGRTGQNLARFLEHEGVTFFALDLDPSRVKEAAAAGESVVYGDSGKREVLIAAGLMRAKALVISFADTPAALKILSHVQALRPDLPVVVRTVDDTDLDRLKQAGAMEVVAEVMEGSLMLASHALMLLGVPLNRVVRRIREAREQRYHLFRGFFRGMSDADDLSDRHHLQLHSVMLTLGAKAVGKTIGELDLAPFHVEIKALRRANHRPRGPDPEAMLEAGDVLVLLGSHEHLAAAEEHLLRRVK